MFSNGAKQLDITLICRVICRSLLPSLTSPAPLAQRGGFKRFYIGLLYNDKIFHCYFLVLCFSHYGVPILVLGPRPVLTLTNISSEFKHQKTSRKKCPLSTTDGARDSNLSLSSWSRAPKSERQKRRNKANKSAETDMSVEQRGLNLATLKSTPC